MENQENETRITEAVKGLGIFKKYALARHKVSKIEFGKSGQNSYKGFSYGELSDILPDIDEIEKELNILSVVTFEPEIESKLAVLTLYDLDDLDGRTMRFTFELANADVQGASPIQQRGAAHTYARRYLYIDTYNVTLKDEVDKGAPQNGRYGAQSQNRSTAPQQGAKSAPQRQIEQKPNKYPSQQLMSYTTTEDGEIIPLAREMPQPKQQAAEKSYYGQIIDAVKEAGVPIDKVQEWCKNEFGVKRFNELTVDQFNRTIKKIKMKKDE